MKHILRVKTKPEHIEDNKSVPRHPQFGFIEYIDRYSWKAHDKITGKQVIVLRKDEGKFVYFEITYSKDMENK